MLATHPSFGSQKRDLHVGGLGSNGSPPAAAVIDPMIEAAGSWLHRTQSAARTAEGFVRTNPWAALAVTAAVSLTAGFLLSRRARA